jgi:hypothetical protein
VVSSVYRYSYCAVAQSVFWHFVLFPVARAAVQSTLQNQPLLWTGRSANGLSFVFPRNEPLRSQASVPVPRRDRR